MQNLTILPDKQLRYLLSDQNSYAKSKWVEEKETKTRSGLFFLYKPQIIWKHTFLAGALWATTVLAQELSIFP